MYMDKIIIYMKEININEEYGTNGFHPINSEQNYKYKLLLEELGENVSSGEIIITIKLSEDKREGLLYINHEETQTLKLLLLKAVLNELLCGAMVYRFEEIIF